MPRLSIVAGILPPDLWAIGLELGDQGSLNQSTRCSALKQLIIFAAASGSEIFAGADGTALPDPVGLALFLLTPTVTTLLWSRR
jgi:hypothetical protein